MARTVMKRIDSSLEQKIKELARQLDISDSEASRIIGETSSLVIFEKKKKFF